MFELITLIVLYIGTYSPRSQQLFSRYTSVAEPKLFDFRSGSGSTFFSLILALAPALFPAIYCHFKMYFDRSNIRNWLSGGRNEFLFILAASNLLNSVTIY